MKLSAWTALAAVALALVACGGSGEVEVADVKKCLESQDFEPTEQKTGDYTSVIVELPDNNSASVAVFDSEDDAKKQEQQLSDLIEGGGGEANRNGNAIALFEAPPSEKDKDKVEDCL